MSLSGSRRRSRRRHTKRAVIGLTICTGIVALIFTSYMVGGSFAEREVARLQREITQFKDRLGALDEQSVKFQIDLREATLQQQHWKQLYERDVPTGPAKDLHARIQARIVEGIYPARLALAIDGVVNEPACDEKPVTKRFIVRTPALPSGNDSVGFADNAITVTAEGKSASDGSGNARAIFDAAQPVHVSFLRLGGGKVDITGVLPIQQSVMTETAEYRFNLVASDTKGFVNVTADRCRAPG